MVIVYLNASTELLVLSELVCIYLLVVTQSIVVADHGFNKRSGVVLRKRLSEVYKLGSSVN
jgi:hypothetical protein